MIPRILEPEVMDTRQEAVDYNAMDHSHVNRLFVDDLLALIHANRPSPQSGAAQRPLQILDVGTGTSLIPIELCRRFERCSVTAIDLAGEMIRIAADNVASAGLRERITLARLDAKQLPFADGEFEVVISNSIVHHIPAPRACMAEMVRVVSSGGLLFARDLLRPAGIDDLERLVTTYAPDANDHQRQMFRASLHAALTSDEVRALASGLGIAESCVHRTSDRHWTLSWRRDAGERASGRSHRFCV